MSEMEKPLNKTEEPKESNDEPIIYTEFFDHQVCLLGTAHVSQASADKVKELLSTEKFDVVAIELCPNRYDSLVNPDNLANMDLFKVIREGKTSMVMASLALGAYQQRLAEEFGIEPGAEMRMAIEQAKEFNTELELVDRDIGVTLKRVYASVPWWKKMMLATGLMASVVSKEDVSKDEVERLKEGDILETTFSQFAEDEKDLFRPLIDERDQFMALQIADILSRQEHKNQNLLAVIGAGHLKGINRYLQQYNEQKKSSEQLKENIKQLEVVPKKSQFLKYFPWVIVALILTGFFLGFQKSSDLGWQMVVDWVVINGGLSALGALIAGAHPLTVIGAFVAAPLTSLNPTIGAGMVTAAIEAWLRKPNVGDFSRLKHDTTSIKGWWNNRVSRTLLVFFFSTLGSAVGTYVAGFRIFESLM